LQNYFPKQIIHIFQEVAMEIEFALRQDNLLVRLQGELDHHQSGRLREAVDGAMERDPVKNLIFNMQGLSFTDSAGVGVLLGRYRKIRERGGRMAVCAVSGAVLKVLQIAGLPRIIPFFQSEAEALEHMVLGRPLKRRS
jgi:stage II sporulation protein AA (anti-sigma F factor antagonist)